MRWAKSRTTSILLTGVFVSLFIWYFSENTDDFRLLLDISALPLLGLIFGHLLVLLSNGLIIKWIMEPFEKHISLRDCFYVSVISSAGNFFLPVGSGAGFRAVYLKKRHGLSYKQFFSTLYGNYIIVFFISSMLGILSLTALEGLKDKNGKTLFIVFSSIAVFMLILSIFKMETFKRTLAKKLGKPGRIIGEISTGWHFILQHRGLLYKLLFAGLLSFSASLLVSYSAFASLGIQLSIWTLILYSSLGLLALLINITPGAIGIKEGIYIFSASSLMLTTAEILSASVIDRSVRFLILFIGWAVLRNFSKKNSEENNSNISKSV